jgi:8-oxo-dGTP diphosphatase
MMLVAAGLVRQGDQLLLVRQQGPADLRASWSLPGGVVEPGELLIDALARELREETGLRLLDPGRVLYSVHTAGGAGSSVAVVFETAAWQGDVCCADPDGLVSAAEFVSCAVALERLAALPYRNMREPLMAYLRGEVGAGALWVYRREAGEVVPITVIPKINLPGRKDLAGLG